MMFNNHNDGNIKPILDLFKKKINTTTILVGLSSYIFILIEKIY